MTSPPSPTSPLFDALVRLKEGDRDGAREQLGITAEAAAELDWVNRMMALEEGLRFLQRGNHSKAFPRLREAVPLVEAVPDADAKLLIPLLADEAEGVSCLLNGDAHRAARLLQGGEELLRRTSFFMPGLEKELLRCRATGELALARIQINLGDLTEAEQVMGRVYAAHRELLSRLDRNNPNDHGYFLEVHATPIEFSLLLMRIDLEALDFDALDRRLSFVREHMAEFQESVSRVEEGMVRAVTEIMQILHDVFSIFARVGRRALIDRQPLAEGDLRALGLVAKSLFSAEKKAHAAGERGRMYLYSINQLKRLQRNLLDVGKVQSTDFGRLSGVISLVALIILVVVIHLTVRPTGSAAIMFFIGELILALIVGFGFEALRFRPLLSLYAEVAGAGSRKSKAS